MPVLAMWCPADAMLGLVVPLGLVASVPTGIVVDLDPEGPSVGGGPTLAELVAREPTAEDLRARVGAAAYLANGGISADAAWPVVSAIVERWPATVLRCAPKEERPSSAVAILPLLPEPFTLRAHEPCVHQHTGFSPSSAPPGIVLPRLRSSTVSALLGGRRPRADRWMRRLATLWDAA